MKIGDKVEIKPRAGDKRKPLTGWLMAEERGGGNPIVALDERSAAALGAQSATFTCNPKRLRVIEEE